ncbi:hypothetical protein GCM10012275_17380 [Longimycelium tulufanense]|uniref:S-adenosyl methyltransferase n=1 Tax=Longimycelium tulufanense TaxID=907463 RepID=A0A8J3FVR3_9PSEU|nr:SAM-dependent methyltransferase [Longimycelium tulufanense]GGM46865.1 hypothetical protein GCM10012275_17380 [Longimycelium tulufanense]
MTGMGGRQPVEPSALEWDRPSAARVYDYYLGGSHNFAIDRAAAEEALRAVPDLPQMTRANRAFLRRAVRYCVDRGIRQFLDIGSGLPTVGPVHEIAPEANVVYVDSDPVVVAHSRAMLGATDRIAVLRADVRDAGHVLSSPEVGVLIDLDRPLAVLMVGLLHFLSDSDDPAGVVARYRDAAASGSHLVLSHATADGFAEPWATTARVWGLALRSHAEVTRLFAGYELLSPGVVHLSEWRPDTPQDVDKRPERYTGYAGVGRKV